jgi:hypothetical protein
VTLPTRKLFFLLVANARGFISSTQAIKKKTTPAVL